MNSQVMGEEKPVFSADDRHDIIDHFRQTPWLWDTSDHNYKNQRARTKSLMQLAELLSQKKGFEIDGIIYLLSL
jgi:hypothetical protein